MKGIFSIWCSPPRVPHDCFDNLLIWWIPVSPSIVSAWASSRRAAHGCQKHHQLFELVIVVHTLMPQLELQVILKRYAPRAASNGLLTLNALTFAFLVGSDISAHRSLNSVVAVAWADKANLVIELLKIDLFPTSSEWGC